MPAVVLPAQQADQGEEGRLKGLSLEELGNIEVTTASKSPVKLSQTPAAVYVITENAFSRRSICREMSVLGQNLLQPRHFEYGSDPMTLVGIKRSVLGSISLRK